MACGKHVLPILIVLKGPRFANQRIDHVAVVDGMLARTDDTGHALDKHVAVPYFDEVGIDHHVDLVSDQAAGNRIGVPLDLDRAAAVDLNSADLSSVVHLRGRQLAKNVQLLIELWRAGCIPLAHQLFEEALVFLAAGKVPASSKQQGLLDERLPMAMG